MYVVYSQNFSYRKIIECCEVTRKRGKKETTNLDRKLLEKGILEPGRKDPMQIPSLPFLIFKNS